MPRRSYRAKLRWATGIILALTAFVAAVTGLGGQLDDTWSAIRKHFAGSTSSDNILVAEEQDDPATFTPPAANDTAPISDDIPPSANGSDQVAGGDQAASPDDAHIVIDGVRYARVYAPFSPTPPDGAYQAFMPDSAVCSCMAWDQTDHDFSVTNKCDGKATVTLARFPHEPLTSKPDFPLSRGQTLNPDAVYADLDMPAMSAFYSKHALVDRMEVRVRTCSGD